MTRKSEIKAQADRLRAVFEAKGAEVFEADILQPAGALLDLYGEDIRARAFVTHDPLRGEMMLRPDFTVPLVQRHMDQGRGQGRYTYAGEVFRRQEDDPERLPDRLPPPAHGLPPVPEKPRRMLKERFTPYDRHPEKRPWP